MGVSLHLMTRGKLFTHTHASCYQVV